MKRLVCVLLIMMMLLPLASCTRGSKPDNTAAPTAENTVQTDNTQEAEATSGAERVLDFSYDPATDFDKRFAHSALWNLCEAEDAFYWLPDGAYVRYCGKEGGDWGVLCGKPECTHDDDNDCVRRLSCNGCIPAIRPTIGYYEGKLYYADTNNRGMDQEKEFGKIMCMDPDGTNKQVVMHIPRLYTSDGKEAQPQLFYFHRGLVFTYGSAQNVDDAVPYHAVCVAYMPLGGTEFTVIYESTEYINHVYMNFAGEFAYMVLRRFDHAEVNETRILRWSTVTHETEKLFEISNGSPINTQRYFITDEGEFYAIGIWEEGKGSSKLYRLEDGEMKLAWQLKGDEEGYSCINVSDGIVIARNYVEFDRNGMSTDIDLLVKSFDGTVLYKGKLPVGWLKEAPEKAVLEEIVTAAGNENELIFQFRLSERNASRSNERATYMVVKYELADGELIETLLGVMHSQVIKDPYRD